MVIKDLTNVTGVFKCFKFKERGNNLFKAKFYRNNENYGSSLKLGDVVMHVSEEFDEFAEVDKYLTICDIVTCVTLKDKQGFYRYDNK